VRGRHPDGLLVVFALITAAVVVWGIADAPVRVSGYVTGEIVSCYVTVTRSVEYRHCKIQPSDSGRPIFLMSDRPVGSSVELVEYRHGVTGLPHYELSKRGKL
jgi:hypothetical protein